MKIYTYRLNNGARVLAQFIRKELRPVGYVNQSQAQKKRDELLGLGFECGIRQWNRNRYIQIMGLPSFDSRYACFEVVDGKPVLDSIVRQY